MVPNQWSYNVDSWDRLQKVDANLSRAILEAKCLPDADSIIELGRIVQELDAQRERCLQAMELRALNVNDPPIVESNVYGADYECPFECDWVNRVLKRLRAPHGERSVSFTEELGVFTIQFPEFLVQINRPPTVNLIDVLAIDTQRHRFYDLVSLVAWYEAALAKAGH